MHNVNVYSRVHTEKGSVAVASMSTCCGCRSSVQLLMMYKDGIKSVVIASEACLWEDEEPLLVSMLHICLMGKSS